MIDKNTYDSNNFDQTYDKINELTSYFLNTGKTAIHEIYSLPDNIEFKTECELNDLKLMEETYKEYFEGMIKFIREVMSIDDNNTDIAIKFNNELLKAKSKDKEFIDSLFCKTTSDVESTSIGVLKNNIDYFCDMREVIKEYNLKVKSLIDTFNYEHSVVKSNSVDFMNTSVNYFLQSVLYHIAYSLYILVKNKDDIKMRNNKIVNKKFCLFI